jgi:hypothetical protein
MLLSGPVISVRFDENAIVGYFNKYAVQEMLIGYGVHCE